MQFDGSACTDCAADCAVCQNGNSNNCQKCYPPARPNDNGVCVACKPPCIACLAQDPSSCLLCDKGFSLVASANNATEGDCFRCDDRFCRYCEENNKASCRFCVEGFYKKNNACERCPLNCKRC